METIIQSLEKTSLDEIHEAFQRAFSDYQVDISYMTREVIEKRFEKNGYQPELSVGVFDRGRLQGFTVVGKGKFKGSSAAFDIMTGIAKDYRGQGIAQKMFDAILNNMRGHHVNRFFLEVLQGNDAAIRAYTKTGFNKTRGLDCYLLKPDNFRIAKSINSIIFIEEDSNRLDPDLLKFMDWEPSWENHPESIGRIPDQWQLITARSLGKTVGFCVYYPTLNWILLLAVDPEYRRKGIGSAILEFLSTKLFSEHGLDEIKLYNVQDDDEATRAFLKQSGFKKITGQFEMMYEIS